MDNLFNNDQTKLFNGYNKHILLLLCFTANLSTTCSIDIDIDVFFNEGDG